jgi:hypothetical protein
VIKKYRIVERENALAEKSWVIQKYLEDLADYFNHSSYTSYDEASIALDEIVFRAMKDKIVNRIVIKEIVI